MISVRRPAMVLPSASFWMVSIDLNAAFPVDCNAHSFVGVRFFIFKAVRANMIDITGQPLTKCLK